MDGSQPLLSFIVARAIGENHGLPPHIRQCLYRCIRNLLAESMTFDQCSQAVRAVVDKADFLLELQAILAAEPAASITRGRQKTRWTEDEDRRLLAAIHRYGVREWATIASFVGNGRTKSQCAQRWRRSLNPAISRQPWQPIEDETLDLAVQRYGECAWIKVSNEVKTRSDVQCRGRWQTLKQQKEQLKPKAQQLQTNDDDEYLCFLDFESSEDDTRGKQETTADTAELTEVDRDSVDHSPINIHMDLKKL
jgi:hypothetical protein